MDKRFEIRTFQVWLNTDATRVDPENFEAYQVHEVKITHQDQLLGEREGAKRGVFEHKLNNTLGDIWAWAALVRTGQYEGTLDKFINEDCANVERVEKVPVDPTQPAADTGSPSPSVEPSPEPASATGSTPTTS